MDANGWQGEWFLEVNGRKVGPFTVEQIQGFLDDGEIRAYHQVTSEQMAGHWVSVSDLLQSQAAPSLLPSGGHTDAPPQAFPTAPPELMQGAGLALSIEPQSIEPRFPVESQITAPLKMSDPEPAPTQPVTSPTDQPTSQAPRESAPEPVFAPAEPFFKTPTVASGTNPQEGAFQPPPRPEILSAEATQDTFVGSEAADPAFTLFNALQFVRERKAAAIQPPSLKPSAPNKPIFKIPNFQAMMASNSKTLKTVRDAIPTRLVLTSVFVGIVLGCLTWGVVKFIKNRHAGTSGSLTKIQKNSPVRESERSGERMEPPGQAHIRHAPPPPIRPNPPANASITRSGNGGAEPGYNSEPRRNEPPPGQMSPGDTYPPQDPYGANGSVYPPPPAPLPPPAPNMTYPQQIDPNTGYPLVDPNTGYPAQAVPPQYPQDAGAVQDPNQPVAAPQQAPGMEPDGYAQPAQQTPQQQQPQYQ